MNNVTDLLRFMYNSWTPEICQSVYGDLGDHIWSKWRCAVETQDCYALAYFWLGLDAERQTMLLDAARRYFK